METPNNISRTLNDSTCILGVNDTIASIAGKSFAYILIFFLSIVGNILIVIIVYRGRELRSTTNFLIANMSVSDLLASVFFMPIAILEIFNGHRTWPVDGLTGLVFCKLVYFIHDVSVAVSVESLTFITIDRFWGIVHPHRRKPFVGRIKRLVGFVWFNAMILHCPFLYTFQLTTKKDGTYCEMIWPDYLDTDLMNKIYFLTLIVFLFVFPLLIIVVLQSFIIKKFYNQSAPRGLSGEARVRYHRRNCKVIGMVLAVIGVFFACWSPIIIYSFIVLFFTKPCSKFELFRFTASFIVESNKAWNFFIYLGFNNTYRRILANLCSWKRKVVFVNGEAFHEGDVVTVLPVRDRHDSYYRDEIKSC